MLEVTLHEFQEDLKLRPDQEPLFDAYAQKIRDLAADVARERRQPATAAKPGLLQRIDRNVDVMRDRLTGVEEIADAARALLVEAEPRAAGIGRPAAREPDAAAARRHGGRRSWRRRTSGPGRLFGRRPRCASRRAIAISLPPGAYSALIPAALISGPHLRRSARPNSASCSGVPPPASKPSASSRWRVSGCCEDLVQLRVQLLDDFLRRALRRVERVPRDHLEARQALLGDRLHARQEIRSLERGHRDGFQLPARHLRPRAVTVSMMSGSWPPITSVIAVAEPL